MKNKTAIIILGIIIIALLAYIALKPKAVVPETTATTNTQPQTIDSADEQSKQNITTQNPKPTSAVPADWKIFSGHSVSISAPSTLKVALDVVHNGESMFEIHAPLLGSLTINRQPDQASYDSFASNDFSSDDVVLTNSNYSVNGISAKLYTMKDSSGINASIIFVPSKFSVIMIIPEARAWSGYSESEVNKMVQSIKFKSN